MIVFFHNISKLQLAQVKEAYVTFVAFILAQVNQHFWLTKWVLVPVNNVHNFTNDNALLFGMMHVLKMHSLFMALLQVKDFELAAKPCRLDVDFAWFGW